MSIVMRVIGSIIMIFGGILALSCLFEADDSDVSGLVGIFVLIILLGLLVFHLPKSMKAHKMRKEERKRQEKKLAEDIEALGIKLMANGEHMTGLPIGEGAICGIFAKEDQLVFVKDEKEYNLDMAKITDVTMKTDTEIREAYVSSAGGAVGGALLFGSLGAMIGGRTVKETTKTIHQYLIFTYIKDSGVNYISFHVTPDFRRAAQLADFTRARISTPDSVDL